MKSPRTTTKHTALKPLGSKLTHSTHTMTHTGQSHTTPLQMNVHNQDGLPPVESPLPNGQPEPSSESPMSQCCDGPELGQ